MRKILKNSVFLAAFAIAFVWTGQEEASANLVQDGDFSQVTYSGTMTGLTTLYGQFGTGYLTVSNWTTTGYNFVYAPGTADAGTQASGANAGQPKQAPGEATAANGYGNTYMWGPKNGSSNGMPSTSPAGGNFIAMDGAYEVGAVKQTITGLTVGQTYALTFYWAGAQQQAYNGTTTDKLTVSLGSTTRTTSTITVADEGFTAWRQETFYYTATNTTETLSFLAAGTPDGEPPFSLLAGVDLEVIPDVSNWMIFVGFGSLCILLESMRRRRARKSGPGMDATTAPASSLEFPGIAATLSEIAGTAFFHRTTGPGS